MRGHERSDAGFGYLVPRPARAAARRSVLSPNVRVNSYAVVEDSVLLDGVDVGRHRPVKRAVVDKGVPPRPVTGIEQ